MKKLNCIMFIDDNPDDNFFHKRVIRKNDFAENIIIKESGEEALRYLKEHSEESPQLIFLDINMPGMNGWEFVEAYEALAPNTPPLVIILLTTSQSSMDKAKADGLELISGFRTKPLTKEMMEEILEQFSDRL